MLAVVRSPPMASSANHQTPDNTTVAPCHTYLWLDIWKVRTQVLLRSSANWFSLSGNEMKSRTQVCGYKTNVSWLLISQTSLLITWSDCFSPSCKDWACIKTTQIDILAMVSMSYTWLPTPPFLLLGFSDLCWALKTYRAHSEGE